MIRPDEGSVRAVEAPHLAGLLRPDSMTEEATASPPVDAPDLSLDFEPAPIWVSRAGRRNLQEKLFAGLVGIKHAVRGDSSFFAHAYRALLVFLTAGMIGVPPVGWCLLVIGLGMVLIAELMHSAVDTLARAIGDPEEPRLKTARDIAAAAVLVAVVVSAAISVTVLTLKLGDYLGWWERFPMDTR
jgi:diacylglycerol kinase